MDNFNEAGRQFSQIMSAGKITEENLGVIKERLPAFAKLMRDTFGTSTAAGLKEAGVGVDEFVAKISAGMQKTKGVTDTAQNAFDNLQAAGTDALNSLGTILLPPVVKGVTAISDALSVASEGMTAFAASSTGKKLFGDLSKGFESFRKSAVNTGKAVGDALEKAGFSVKSRDIQNAISRIGDAFKAAGAAVERFTASAGFRNFVSSVAQGARAIVDGFRPVVSWFQQNMPLIRRTVETVVGFITQFWRDHGQQIVAVVGPVYEQVKNAVVSAVTIIGNTIKLILQVVNGDWKDAGATAQKIGENIVSYIGRTFTNLGSLLRGMVTLAISATNDILNRMTVAATGIARSFYEGFKAALGDFWRRVGTFLQSNFESAKSGFAGIGTSVGSAIADGIKAAIGGGPQGLLAWFKALLSDLWRDFQSFLSGKVKQSAQQKSEKAFLQDRDNATVAAFKNQSSGTSAVDSMRGFYTANKNRIAGIKKGNPQFDPAGKVDVSGLVPFKDVGFLANKMVGGAFASKVREAYNSTIPTIQKSAQSRFTESYGTEGVYAPVAPKVAPKKTTTTNFGTGGKTNFGGTTKPEKTDLQKAIESEMESLKKAVVGREIALRQLRAVGAKQLKSANIADMGQSYPHLDLKSGATGKLASDYLKLGEAIKDANQAIADEAAATGNRESLYKSLQTQILLLRDSSLENQISVAVHNKAYKDLTAEQKENLRGTIDLQKEEKGLTQAQEAATKKAEERRAAQERLSDSLKTASLNLRMFRASVDGLDDSANPMILSLQQLEKSFFKLDFATQINIVSQALFNQKLLDGKGLEAHKKRIADLVNQYKSLTHAGSDWSKFLIAREGTDFEAGIDPEKLKRLREEFTALGNVEQAGGLARLRDRIREMKIAVGETVFPTTEARLAYEQFGKKVEELSPEIAAEVRKTAKEFDRLADKIKKIEMIKQVGQTIKDVFQNAFTTVLQTGKGFFSALIDGFKQAIIRILAEKAAAAVASGAEDLIGQIFKTKNKEGEDEAGKGNGAGSTYGAMSQALQDAKRTPTPVIVQNAAAVGETVGKASANNLAPMLSQFAGMMGGAGGIQAGAGADATNFFTGTPAAYLTSQLFGKQAGQAVGGITKIVGSLFSGLGFASGGRPPVGKFSLVGERGPELVHFGSPAQVMSNKDSRAMMGGGQMVEQINIQNATFNDQADVRRMRDYHRNRARVKTRLL